MKYRHKTLGWEAIKVPDGREIYGLYSRGKGYEGSTVSQLIEGDDNWEPIPPHEEPVKKVVRITIGENVYTAPDYVADVLRRTLEEAKDGKVGLGNMGIKSEQPVQENKEPVLLVTEDGKTIYRKDTDTLLYAYNTNSGAVGEVYSYGVQEPITDTWKHFSTSEARDQYIVINKPVLSITDIMQLDRANIRNTINADEAVIKYKSLGDIVRDKLKQHNQ